MVANYPTIVRRFQPHKDATEFVLAGHMNDVQDEITAIETTLGPRPHVWAPITGAPSVYSSVGSRLDAVQLNDVGQQAQIDHLLDASKTGWSLPLISVVATGTTIPPTPDWDDVLPSDWHPLRWTQRVVDTEGTYSSGPNIVIPKNGWWIMTSTIGMPDPSDGVNVAHYLWARARVTTSNGPPLNINIDLAQGDSSTVGSANGFHRITLAMSGDFFAGDVVQVQLRHVFRPTDPHQPDPPQQSMNAASRTQLTYIRGLPPTPRPIIQKLPYEIGT